VPLPWNERFFSVVRPKIGYFSVFDLLEPDIGSQRAVLEAVQLLRKRGYEVVEFQSPPMLEIIRLYVGIVMADENKALYRNMDWDKYDSSMFGITTSTTLLHLPTLLQKLVIHPLLAALTRISPVKKVFSKTKDLWVELARRDELKQEYLKSMNEKGVDVILTPAQMLPAPPNGVMGTFVAGIIPYVPWNLFNFPAGIAPVTKYSESDVESMHSFPSDDLAYKMMKGYCEGAEGLPLAVQVVGKPYLDEQVLKILAEFQDK
jgi:Asp-tRNA(Asn)/Glu-tRNA(Gln) amidotransferase A subunit family amidase